MSGINKVILVGNVGKDPEVKYLDSGVAVASFPLATSESYKDKKGDKVTTTEWHNVVLWRGLAEIAEKFVKKGSKLYIEGKIKTETSGEGSDKRYFTKIVGRELQMLDNKPVNSEQAEPQPAAEHSEEPSDDLPF